MAERAKDGPKNAVVPKASVVNVIGLMSGTSLDGIDAAVLETDGEDVVRPGPALSAPYLPLQREILRAALTAAPDIAAGAEVPRDILNAEKLLTLLHCDAVKRLLKEARLKPVDVAAIGFHGQTILHRPNERRTWQIGDGALLAHWTGIAVVNDFRTADVAAGGQGGPLAPLYHAALVKSLSPVGGEGKGKGMSSTPPHPDTFPRGASGGTAVVNIGGVANVTYVGANGQLIAFDTGPGNAAIDDWASRHTGDAMDRDSKLARAGRVNAVVLGAMLAHEFFSRPPPKSLDRNDFTFDPVSALSAEDGAATLTAFTAAAIARAAEHFPQEPKRWIVCGGGRHNPFLMEQLRKRVSAPLQSADTLGWRGDSLEAEAFAYLALRSMKGLPLSLPTTTGVPRPMTGGRLHSPK